MLIADIDPLTGKLVSEPLFELDMPVPFKGDQQVHGRLSEDIQLQGLSVLRTMLRKAGELGAVEACAVATEVFRVAPNGAEFLDRVRALGLSVSVVTQPLEARLGLATAEALEASAQHELASRSDGITAWDSGGGSFQITTRAAAFLNEPLRNAELRAYTGRIGTSPAFKALVVQVLGREYEMHASPNPVSFSHAEALVDLLSSQLDPPPAWLRGQHVRAIGGHNCLFAVALRALRGGGADVSGATLSPGQMREALGLVVGKQDPELEAVSGVGPHADRPLVVVPKLALLVAVAERLQLGGVTYLRTTGSCVGMMSLCDFTPLRIPAQECPEGYL